MEGKLKRWPKGVPRNATVIIKSTRRRQLGSLWRFPNDPPLEDKTQNVPYVVTFGNVNKAVKKLNETKGGVTEDDGWETTVSFYAMSVPYAPTRKQWREANVESPKKKPVPE